MGQNKERYMEEQAREEGFLNEYHKPNKPAGAIELLPGRELIISKRTAEEYHAAIRAKIMDTGMGAIEYVEILKFFENLKTLFHGDSTKKEGDPRRNGDSELREMVMEEIRTHGKEFTSGRGVRFELAETGTAYDFTLTTSWVSLDKEIKELQEKKKELEKYLKAIPAGKEVVDTETGEVYYGPAKSSKSSFKVTIGKS